MAEASSLYEIDPEDTVHVTTKELAGLYDRVLVKGGGRETYMAIRSATPYGRCPLCGQRDVRTLDHYLPQALFPEFAVLPINLVPSCFDCNHAKLAHLAEDATEQMFHPYFDDWGQFELVQASLIFADTVYVEFSVNVAGLPPLIAERMSTHFDTLDLATLYSNHASIELVQKRTEFEMTFNSDGGQGLQADLAREAESRNTPFPNAWQPVLYRALANSEQFCQGGFLIIDH
jgi:hypothetical protein